MGDGGVARMAFRQPTNPLGLGGLFGRNADVEFEALGFGAPRQRQGHLDRLADPRLALCRVGNDDAVVGLHRPIEAGRIAP